MQSTISSMLNQTTYQINRLQDESDPEKLKYIQTIQSSSNTMLGIINDILDFSKIEKIDFNSFDELNPLSCKSIKKECLSDCKIFQKRWLAIRFVSNRSLPTSSQMRSNLHRETGVSNWQ